MLNYKSASKIQKLKLYIGLTLNRAKEGHLPAIRQIFEMFALYFLRAQGPGYYHTAGFWRKELCWQDKLDHINAREYRSIIKDLNPQNYQKSSQNKIIEKAILQLYKIPGSQFLGYLEESFGYDHLGHKLQTLSDFTNLIYNSSVDNICFKPIESWAGKGFLAVKITRNKNNDLIFERMDNSVTLTAKELFHEVLKVDLGHAWLIEDYLYQHEWYAKLNPSSVNTYRLWVVKENNMAKTKLAYLRIGRAGSLIDNQSSGGIVAPVNLTTGILGPAIDGLPTRELWTHHPDTKTAIQGQKPPFFVESLQLAEKSLSCFQGLSFAGVDVAVCSEGPVIIELNVDPDREGAAFTDIPAKKIIFNKNTRLFFGS